MNYQREFEYSEAKKKKNQLLQIERTKWTRNYFNSIFLAKIRPCIGNMQVHGGRLEAIFEKQQDQ